MVPDLIEEEIGGGDRNFNITSDMSEAGSGFVRRDIELKTRCGTIFDLLDQGIDTRGVIEIVNHLESDDLVNACLPATSDRRGRLNLLNLSGADWLSDLTSS